MKPALDSVKPGDTVAIAGGHAGTVAVVVARVTPTQIITATAAGREQRWSRSTGLAVPRGSGYPRRWLCAMTPDLAERAEINAALDRAERALAAIDTRLRQRSHTSVAQRLSAAADALETALELLSEEPS